MCRTANDGKSIDTEYKAHHIYHSYEDALLGCEAQNKG